jgi:putative selenium metabolism hydrolase
MDAVKILKLLISTKSVTGGEEEIAGVLKDLLRESGVDNAWIDSVGNVVARVNGGGAGSVLLEGHMDTVEVGDLRRWHVHPFSAKVIDGILYGRGAVDMKGGIAAQVAAINNLRELNVDVYLVYTVQEEVAEGVAFRHGIKEVMNGGLPDVSVTGEPTSLNVSLGQRGRALVRVDVRGITAHAALPQEGINALSSAADLIRAATRENSSLLPEDKVLGRETSTPVGITCTPENLPQLPDKCIITFDHRMVPGREKDLLDYYLHICSSLKEESRCEDCRVAIIEGRLRTWRGVELAYRNLFPGWVNMDETMVKEVLRAVKEVYARASRYYWRFSTDLVYTSGELGLPGLGLGPGNENMAHKPDEGVSIKEVNKAVEEYLRLIKVLDVYLPSRAR